ncbi:MAG: hypothetical protein BWY83_01862 [bacterium ADurb.Bin478]|nr:MAG: hypothetical protein BWY83_01862 [bacterium ADurb.Bin478]
MTSAVTTPSLTPLEWVTFNMAPFSVVSRTPGLGVCGMTWTTVNGLSRVVVVNPGVPL